MTFARLLETGSGGVAVRLMIEGLGVEFVSDPAMEKTTSDGRRRICCLPPMGEGLIIEESVNIPEARLEAQGCTVQIQETQDEDISQVFAWRPDVERLIDTTIETGDVTVTLLSTSGISTGDVVHVGTEAMYATVNSATELLVQRGYWDTIAQKHWSNETTIGVPYRMLTNRPMRIRGRRVYLYLYGSGDALQGDGTLKWRGTVTSEPRCSEAGSVWQLQIASVAERMKGKLGGELEGPMVPRGIYYHWSAPLRIEITEGSGDPVAWSFTGFFETQQEFIAELDSQLAAQTSALDNSYRAVETDDGRWNLQVQQGALGLSLWVHMQSPVDGYVAAGLNGLAPGTTFVTEEGAPLQSTATGTIFYPAWVNNTADSRLAPRGYFGEPDIAESQRRRYTSPISVSIFPDRRLHLSNVVAGDWGVVTIEWPDGTSRNYAVTASSSADNSIDLRYYGGGEDDPPAFYGAYSLPQISPARLLVSAGTLADLRDAVIADSVEYCNRGTAPFITDEDLADWTRAVSEATRGYRWLQRRQWAAVSPMDIEEVFSHEMRLLGVFPIIDESGKIALAPIDIPNLSTSVATAIDDEICSVEWSSMERGGQTINRVTLRTRYDVREDDWLGGDISVVEMNAYAADHTDHELVVEPRSVAVTNTSRDRFGYEEVSEVVLPVLSLFGYPHDFATVHVSWKLFDVTMGSFVQFSAEHLPDYNTGVRPVSSALGIVTGRRWALGEAYGTLTVLIPWLNVAGYAPTARVGSQVNVSGNTWDIEVSLSLYAPADSYSTDFFAVGDRVRIIEYDTESPTVIAGTVVSVDAAPGQTIRVTFDSAWTPGSATWELCYASYNSSTDDQRRFAYIADATGLVGTEGPRSYSA